MAKNCGYSPSNKIRKSQSKSQTSGSAIRSFTRASAPSAKVSKTRGTVGIDVPTPKGR